MKEWKTVLEKDGPAAVCGVGGGTSPKALRKPVPTDGEFILQSWECGSPSFLLPTPERPTGQLS